MNRLIFIGRLTSDPEIRTTQDGKYVARFRLAVNRTFKKDGDPDADFFGCTAFGKTAETFEKLHIGKGTKLCIEGELRNNNYKDKDGVAHYENRVIVNSFEFCESKGTKDASQGNEQPQSNDFVPLPDDLEDEGLPF